MNAGNNYIKLLEVKKSAYMVEYFFDVSANIRRFFNENLYLVAEYDIPISKVPDGYLRIPFVGNTIQLANLLNATLYIDVLDEDFYNCLSPIQSEYKKMYPDCSLDGNVVVERLEKNFGYVKNQSAQLYTGGMDATATFIKHIDEKPVLVQEYGAYRKHNVNEEFQGDKRAETNYNSDRTAAIEFASQYSVLSHFIKSNYVKFFKMRECDVAFSQYLHDGVWHGIQHALAIMSIAAPVLYMERIKQLYIASSNYKERDIPCASSPKTDNLIKFGETIVIHDGFEMKDEDKARSIVRFNRETGKTVPLRVCSWNDGNCCNCEKCIRRMLQINAEGGNPKNFGFAYDGTLYEKVKGFLYNNAHSLSHLNIVTWKATINRSIENLDNVFDKDVVLFLKSFDFIKEQHNSLLRYYKKNFLKIIIKKAKKLIKQHLRG